MSLSAAAHSVIRAALSVADQVDPLGRFRALLHIVRLTGEDRVDEILRLRVANVLLDGDTANSGCGFPAIQLEEELVPLDQEARRELSAYLRHRTRRIGVRLYRVRRRGDTWYVDVWCAGATASASLRTTSRDEALRRLPSTRRRLAKRARARDSGWLFPRNYRTTGPIARSQLRLWLSSAVGRQADSESRRKAAKERPIYRVQERRPRG